MDLKACLQYAEGVVGQLSDLSDTKKRHFRQMIARIRSRSSNPYLHTALIGDFSTGKSTFINALLGQELLKSLFNISSHTSFRRIFHCSALLNLEIHKGFLRFRALIREKSPRKSAHAEILNRL